MWMPASRSWDSGPELHPNVDSPKPSPYDESVRAAAPVYRLLGAGDFTAEELPRDGQLIDGTLGYFLRPGAHSLLREDWKAFLDFADKHLGRP